MTAIAVAAAMNALDGFDVLSIAFASPGIAVQWRIERAALGLVLSAELAGMAVGAFALGSLADRVGRRPTILVCLALMASGMAMAAVAPDLVTLLLVRLYTGLGIGGMIAAANAIVAEWSNLRRRDLAIAVMAGGYPLGAVIGGTIASALLAATGCWQSIFAFGAVASTAFIPLVLWLVPETVTFLCERQPRDALSRVNRVLRAQGRKDVLSLPQASGRSHRAPVAGLFAPDMRMVTVSLAITYCAHIMAFYFLMKWIPKVVADIGYSAVDAARVLVWANVGGTAGALTLSLLTLRFGVRPLVVAAMTGSFLAIAAFGQHLSTILALSIAAATAGFFANGAIAGLYAVLARSFPGYLRGSGIGFVLSIARGGAALGPVLAGFLFAAGWPLAWVAPAIASGCIVGAFLLSRTTLSCARSDA